NLTERMGELKLQLEKKEALLEQVEIIRKTIEKTAIQKEKEYAQFKLKLQEKSKLFEQEAAIRSEKEKALSEKEKEYEHLKETSESLKDVLVKRGIARELTLPEEKGELWILGKSPERRNSPRLALTKDFHNTVILKIELPGPLRNIKSFAENISSSGLCFQTQKELNDDQPINLRLFFYGGKVPNFKTQGWIVWKRPQDSKIYYGITFEGLSEKVKSELQHYIEVNIPRG
ncbi:MAG: PilZ domain-containing protein, partial [Candidatus Omnitrophica bacterium]|nr:PilZ domain-containing protein [Candidatus Omnitrophota bacterium]MBU1906360.1 PilZ domain-containing protein [Candidatus Omnitrophota bacterium]